MRRVDRVLHALARPNHRAHTPGDYATIQSFARTCVSTNHNSLSTPRETSGEQIRRVRITKWLENGGGIGLSEAKDLLALYLHFFRNPENQWQAES